MEGITDRSHHGDMFTALSVHTNIASLHAKEERKCVRAIACRSGAINPALSFDLAIVVESGATTYDLQFSVL
jgi:hypothetical protein